MQGRPRRHPAEIAGRLRPDRAEQRRIEAAARQAARNEETPEQQIAALDARFGAGNGAARERARLAKAIAANARRAS
jgi:hypothetical protein